MQYLIITKHQMENFIEIVSLQMMNLAVFLFQLLHRSMGKHHIC